MEEQFNITETESLYTEQITKILTSKNVNPHQIDAESGLPLLHAASLKGKHQLVEALITHIQFFVEPFKDGLNYKDPHTGTTALHKACEGGHLKTVKTLLLSLQSEIPRAANHFSLQVLWLGMTQNIITINHLCCHPKPSFNYRIQSTPARALSL